jgi:hypothetical protein
MHGGAVGLFHRKQRQDFQIVMYQRSSHLLEIRQRDAQHRKHFRGADGISIRLYVFAHNNLRIFLTRQSRSQDLNSVICARVLSSSFAHLETDIGRKKAARDNGD